MRRPNPLTLILAGLVAPLTTSMLPGCERAAPAAPVIATLTARGRIESLPETDNPASGLSIWHEDIPGWIHDDGSKGMRSMPMEFPLAPNVSLQGLAVDDKVEFVVEQFKSGPIPHRLIRIQKLPATIELNFNHMY